MDAIDDQLHALQVEGMNQLPPWSYLALQPQVDHLVKQQHELRDTWNERMFELANCRSGQR
jgi:hypothetical protein